MTSLSITRSISTLLLTTVLFGTTPALTAPRTWVILRDKGSAEQDPLTLVKLRASLPERCLKRRLRNGADVGTRDLPVAEAYIRELEEVGARVVERSRWLNAVSVTADSETLRRVAALPCVAGLQPVAAFGRDSGDGVMVEPLPQTPPEPSQPGAIPPGAYGFSYRQAEQAGVVAAHARGLTGEGVLLGSLDTGFQFNHRAFAGVDLVAQYDFIFDDPDPSWDPLHDPRGQANHGTGCLSVIVGYDPGFLVGIAPRVAVAVAKTELTGSETPVEEDYWVAGLEWLEWLGVDVVTSSLSYRDWYRAADYNGVTPLVSRAAQRAVELGVVVCNSAGNAGPGRVTIGAPSDAVGVLGVAAVDRNGEVTGFSSRGPSGDGRIKPDVAALGKGVVCVTPLTWGRYSRWNGTSLSCPIVAGVAALVIEAHPDWNSALVTEAVKMTADRWFRPDFKTGYGIVDAAAAVDYPAETGHAGLFPPNREPPFMNRVAAPHHRSHIPGFSARLTRSAARSAAFRSTPVALGALTQVTADRGLNRIPYPPPLR